MNIEAIVQAVGLLGIAAIVFAENGLLIGFFLPGDSLLFTAGFLAAQGYFNIWILVVTLFLAAVVGVAVGYWIGHRFGRSLFRRPDSRLFKHENLERAERFYEQHGGKTIILARFIPIVRTFAPIVAGVGRMDYGRFMIYNLIGGLLWVVGLTWAGYWLGGRVANIDRFLLPIIALIIILSMLPGLVHLLRTPERRRSLWQRLRFFRRQP
ncbi:MAG: VTT domain-containing protein [Candidatus Kerfeldbacteria bacterium]|nr:VTT domain-containing protein [Candidatus Kerfeldbacteria bacterium]